MRMDSGTADCISQPRRSRAEKVAGVQGGKGRMLHSRNCRAQRLQRTESSPYRGRRGSRCPGASVSRTQDGYPAVSLADQLPDVSLSPGWLGGRQLSVTCRAGQLICTASSHLSWFLSSPLRPLCCTFHSSPPLHFPPALFQQSGAEESASVGSWLQAAGLVQHLTLVSSRAL